MTRDSRWPWHFGVDSNLRRAPAAEAIAGGRRASPQVVKRTKPVTCQLSALALSGCHHHLTSITVRPCLKARATHFSSSNATLQTASPCAMSSRTRCPVLRSQIFTRPSLPPLTTRVSSNCKLVTLLSCAARRWIGVIFSNDHTRTDPSDPPVTRVSPRICSWPTSDVWPWRIARHSLHSNVSSRSYAPMPQTHTLIWDPIF